MFEVTPAWKSIYPGARVGVLVMRSVTNPAHHPDLESRKALLERQLRSQFAGQDRSALASHPVLQAYAAYYRRFKKTYHIQLQLESILWKGKSIPGGAGLVEAMFMAEMQDLLLTAGHDLDALHLPMRLDAATGSERYVLLRGDEQTLKAGDMMISDGQAVISSILYGPDQRTQITAGTRNAVFTVYAPPGIDEPIVGLHLQHIRENVMLCSPEAKVESQDIYEGV